MEKLRKAAVFVLILLLLAAGTALTAWDLVSQCVSTLASGVGGQVYSLVASGADKKIYALGQDQKGYFLSQGDRSGHQTGFWRVDMSAIGENTLPQRLYVNSDDFYILSLFDLSKSPAELVLYRFDGGTAERLLALPTTGDNLREQMANVGVTDFWAADATSLYFGVRQGDTIHFYRTSITGGVEQLESVTQPDLRDGLIRGEGSWAIATGDQVIRRDLDPAYAQGQNISHLTWANMGAYYLNETDMVLYCADFFIWQPYPYMALEREGVNYDLDHCTYMTIDRDGEPILLLDGMRLVLDDGTNVTDLTGMLHRAPWKCALILAGLGVGVTLVTLLLWYVVCEARRLRLPLLVRWGTLIVATAVLAVAALAQLAAPRSIRAAAEREGQEMLEITTRLAMAEDLPEEDLPRHVAAGLVGTEGGTYRDVRAALFTRDASRRWYLAADSTGIPTGSRGELYGGFDRGLVQRALEEGSSFGTEGPEDHPRFVFCQSLGQRVLTVDVDGDALLAHSRTHVLWTVRELAALAALITLLALMVLLRVTLGLRRIMGGVDALNAGEREVSIRQGGGDELTSLAEDVNALSRTIGALEERHGEMERAYRRFVPERVLSLLGKQSIAQVDKRAFATRHLAAMTFSFRFPDQVYQGRGETLFENINEILERTASIVTEKGGAVFNFAYGGYDAVFEAGSAVAVSAAVAIQQEILEINSQRQTEDRPPVTARIALDEGDVILGVVGDEAQIEPTSISASFSATQHLLELCDRLEANILCTEAVAAKAEGYACRYMGKCAVGGALLRTYEIFDGDPYESRKLKGQTKDRFAEGVYALYAGDFSQAKRVFLSLVRQGTGDGGARYYLYLANQMEKDPQETPSLDPGSAFERE